MNNKDIDDLLKFASLRKDDIPENVEKRITETLKMPKKQKGNFGIILRRLFAIIISGLTIAASGIGVYATMGGEIAGRPAFEFFGVKTKANIEDYMEKVEGQEITYKDTKVELVSSICNEGITILEFNVKLSKEDKEKLLIEQSAIRQEDYDSFEEFKNSDIASIYFGQYNPEDVIKEQELNLKKKEESKYTLALALNTNQVIGKYTPDEWNPDLDLYGSVYIDGQGYYCKNWQKTEKISEYEYRIYQMYLITDNELQGKEEFTINLKGNSLVNIEKARFESGEICKWSGEAQQFKSGWLLGDDFYQEKRLRSIDLDGEFEVKVSKNKIMNDSKVLDNLNLESNLGNIKIEVQKATITPLQTIVQIKHTANQLSTNNRQNENDGIEWFPMTSYYDVYDENGNKLDVMTVSNWKTLIYEDGTTRTYDSHDIPQETIKNASLENVLYMIIETTDTSKITIVPHENVLDDVYTQMDNYNEKDRTIQMDKIEVDLK